MARFALPSGRLGFDGSLLLAQRGSSIVYSLPFASYNFSPTDNVARPDVIDADAITHIESSGIRMATLEYVALFMPDRGMNGYIDAMHGPPSVATNRYTDWDINIIPYGGGTVQKAGFAWPYRTSVVGQFGVPGQQNMVMIRGTFWVLDPDNVQGISALTVPSTLGVSGAGVAPFSRASLTDGATPTPNNYGMTNFGWSLENRLGICPSIVDPVHRIASGCVPAPLRGGFTTQQLSGNANPLPGSGSHPGMTLNLPTGDGTHTYSLDLSLSYDQNAQSFMPSDFVKGGYNYALFGSNAANTTAVANAGKGWLYTNSYV